MVAQTVGPYTAEMAQTIGPHTSDTAQIAQTDGSNTSGGTDSWPTKTSTSVHTTTMSTLREPQFLWAVIDVFVAQQLGHKNINNGPRNYHVNIGWAAVFVVRC